MNIPEGFCDLVKLAIKSRPKKPSNSDEIWDRFVRIVFIGGKRSDADVSIIINILKKNGLLSYEYVLKTTGEDWREAASKAVDERLSRVQDDDMKTMLKDFQKEMFRICASIKGGGRFFKQNEISPEKLEEMLSTKEKTWDFIEGLAKNEDVPNIKYTKVIFWLHSMGFGQDFCPPSWHVKKFVNEVFGYYQFYEDDSYFMQKAAEFGDEIRKKIKDATNMSVSSAMFYHMSFKSMLPQRSMEKKKFKAPMILKFLKTKKLALDDVSKKMSMQGERDELAQAFYDFVHGQK